MTTRRMHGRAGFTLFEIAISALVLVIGVLTTVAFSIQASRAQQLTRFKLLASAKALDVIDAYNNVPLTLLGVRTEGRALNEVVLNRVATAPDLEHHAVTCSTGIYPLPSAIARRLDSDGEEIRRIIDDGGAVYYFGPTPGSLGLDPSKLTGSQDATMQKAERSLIFGVRGYAQQNALAFHPQIAWPYYQNFPGHPATDILKAVYTTRVGADPVSLGAGVYKDEKAITRWPSFSQATTITTVVPAALTGTPVALCADMTNPSVLKDILGNDHDIALLNDWECRLAPFLPFDVQVFQDVFGAGSPQQLDVERYFRAFYTCLLNSNSLRRDTTGGNWNYFAKYYAVRLLETVAGVAAGTYLSNKNTLRYAGSATDRYPDGSTVATSKRLPARVAAWSYVAFCSMSLTSSATPTQPTAATVPPMPPDMAADAATIVGLRDAAAELTMAREDHNIALEWAMNFHAFNPYDFRVFRAHQRHTCFDFPLFQADLFSQVADSDERPGQTYPGAWKTWKVVYNRDFDHQLAWNAADPAGSSCLRLPKRSYDGLWRDIDLPGGDKTTATWQGDLDNFNLSAPFAGADRCRQLVFWAADWQSYRDFESQPSEPYDSSRQPQVPVRQNVWSMRSVEFVAAGGTSFNQYARFGNPETPYCFRDATRTTIGATTTGNNPPSTNPSTLGYFGVDRNGSGTYDEGTLDPGVRLKAVTVGRFNFYDRRLAGTIR